MQTEDPISHERVQPLHSNSALSTTAVIDSPPDPSSIPVQPPNGTPAPLPGHLLPDVHMVETRDAPNGIHFPNGTPLPQLNGVNGHARTVSPSGSAPNLTKTEMDVDGGVASSASFPAPDSAADLPPAKRARKFSDADQASLNHTNGNGHPSSVPTVSSSPLSPNQHRFALSTIRNLKKMKDAAPFLLPVDPVALNIPHYPSIIKHPMDIGTIERKLVASNPSKPGPEPRYHSVDDFIADVRLIFSNCSLFNGAEHLVSQMGKRVEEVFEKQIKNMPASEEPKPIVVKRPSPTPAVPKKVPRRPSAAAATVPTIRRTESETTRPKREIHPPAPKDLPYADIPKKTRPKKIKDDGTVEQLKFCQKLISEIFRKQHYSIASPFYEPVDWVKLDLPAYPKLVKKPMDLSTMQKKLQNRDYQDAASFYSDFKLMIRNCFTFNPVGNPVNQAGIELSQFFDDRWKQLPALKDVGSDEDEDDEDDSDDEVAALNAQLEMVKNQMAVLSSKKKKKKDKTVKPLGAGPSKSSAAKKKGKSRAPVDDEVLSFEQKKDLSETIQTLDGAKLERVIQIIHEGVPEIRDSTEEIELDIDALPAAVLLKLYNYVLRPIRPKPGGASRPGGGRHSSGGTGGLKRKSMDEEAEAERIRLLEERIRLFDKEQSGAAGGERGSAQSSDSSDSDSSGSDSD